MYGPPPTSPLYQGDCSETPDPNPYFPKPAVRWRPQPQFWYQGDPCPPNSTWPVGDPDDYKFETLPQPQSEKTLLEEMEIERPERYLPGEIYRNERPKRPIEDLSKTSKKFGNPHGTGNDMDMDLTAGDDDLYNLRIVTTR
ncbi:uncharacterized protein LOC124358736 isoform X2 [Homalodisca vitripennis]|uniref:uncharacterized protein LOC124358736 isoform X2 n=1 Tax=Homalodisca vitripennis TaxID=197043 RepID=UPI001EEB0D00|nr:uncharacterized protein LOC124358736 isoform X2 [Homalodisca vitripennis]